MAAAIEAVARDCQVTVIDEGTLPGGQIFRQSDPSLDVSEYAETGERARKHALLARFQEVSNRIEYRSNATAFALFANREIHVSQSGATEVLRPNAIVLATGVREMAVPFPGWTTPGVMFAGGMQSLLKAHGVLAGRNIVVAGCGPLPLVVAAQAVRAGGSVRALASLHPMRGMLAHPLRLWQGRQIALEGVRYAWTVLRSGVERLDRFVPVRAIGKDNLEAVLLAKLDLHGLVIAGSEREIACDVLAVNYGFTANSELAAMAGAKMRFDALAGGWIPEADAFGRTSIAGVFVAGDGSGLRGAIVAGAQGQIAGAAAAQSASGNDGALRSSLRRSFTQRRQAEGFQVAVRETLRLPAQIWRLASDDTVVCRCENISCGQIREVFSAGHKSLNAVKRNVRAGMGWCGGKICLRTVAALAELELGAVPEGMMTPRPLIRPVTFAALASQKKASVA
jgi:thioredoxin reductase